MEWQLSRRTRLHAARLEYHSPGQAGDAVLPPPFVDDLAYGTDHGLRSAQAASPPAPVRSGRGTECWRAAVSRAGRANVTALAVTTDNERSWQRAAPMASSGCRRAIAATEAARLRGHTGQINGLAFAPDGRLASAGDDNSDLWDVAAPGSAPLPNMAPVLAVAFSQTNRLALHEALTVRCCCGIRHAGVSGALHLRYGRKLQTGARSA